MELENNPPENFYYHNSPSKNDFKSTNSYSFGNQRIHTPSRLNSQIKTQTGSSVEDILNDPRLQATLL